MDLAFYASGTIAVLASVLAVTRRAAAWALVWLAASLLATAVVLFTLGGPFVAAMEAILYAGAVMVLFVFAVMMLNVARPRDAARRWPTTRAWLGPALLAAALLTLLIIVLLRDADGLPAQRDAGVSPARPAGILPARDGETGLTSFTAQSNGTHNAGETPASRVTPKQLSMTLFTHYVLAVELAGVLLLTAVVGVVHIGRRHRVERRP